MGVPDLEAPRIEDEDVFVEKDPALTRTDQTGQGRTLALLHRGPKGRVGMPADRRAVAFERDLADLDGTGRGRSPHSTPPDAQCQATKDGLQKTTDNDRHGRSSRATGFDYPTTGIFGLHAGA